MPDQDQLLAEIASLKESLTDQQHQIDQLRQSEKKYLNLFRDSAIGMVVVMSDGRIAQSNKAFCDFLGYSEQELFGKTVLSLAHPDDREASSQAIRQTFSAGSSIQRFDKRYLHKSGQVVWGEITNTLITDGDGKPSYAIAQVLDINERKQNEEALHEAHDELEHRVEERTAELAKTNEELVLFRKFAEASGEGFAMGDLNSQIAYVNPALCRLFGEDKPEDLIGRSFFAYYPQEWEERRKVEIIPTQERTGHWAGEQAILSKQGKLIPTLQDVFLLRDEQGNPVRRCMVVTDISERKQAEEALRQSEEKFRTLVETSPDAVLMADLRGRVTFASRRALELYGSENLEDILGKDPLTFIAPKDHPKYIAIFRRTLEVGIARNIELMVLRKDGTPYPAELSAAVIRDSSGEPIALSCLVRDITERKQAQQALQREHRTLKHLLQSSDHERQSIAYEIHDGLAQYLASAIMQFDVYRHLMDSKPNDAMKAYEEAITLIRQSHAEARSLIAGVRPPVLDEAGVVEAIAHLVNEQNREEGPQVKFHSLVAFKRLVPLLENAIYRIIQAGMTNACKYSQSSRVRITLLQQKERIRIEIRDWGTGFNLKNVKTKSYGLIGIRERARLLGGKYRLQSAATKGTRIVVELPLMEREK